MVLLPRRARVKTDIFICCKSCHFTSSRVTSCPDDTLRRVVPTRMSAIVVTVASLSSRRRDVLVSSTASRRRSHRHARRRRGGRVVVDVRACRRCREVLDDAGPVRGSLVPVRGTSENEREPSTSTSTSTSRTEGDLRDAEERDDGLSYRVAMSLLDFYKTQISPVLPKSCRFVPTCSEYARQAYTKYGTKKGFILTAWRIMRCNPLGDSGYDPPVWPPPYLGGERASLD